ncbi:Fat storage-inducing transmembrane protein [Syncephalis plumigaleata]|nr:Fat storage-inducing transmembrane protein [Syncephalis plumigaleata]
MDVTETDGTLPPQPNTEKQMKLMVQTQNIQRFTAALTRWMLATAYWWIITQWMVGPSLSDRVYRWSGGRCYPIDEHGQPVLSGLVDNENDMGQSTSDPHQHLFNVLDVQPTAIACRQAGGRWHGGHDISGHIMLLIHASLFLQSELSGLRRAAVYSTAVHPRMARRATRLVRYLLVLWWWMLLMSSVYAFHPLSEKVTGLIMGLLYWVVMYVYILPRTSFPGMPGQV